MKIKHYLQDLLRERLASAECLVLYDPDERYRELSVGLSGDQCCVVDGSASTIQGTEESMGAWLALGTAAPGNRQLLVYLPTAKPLTEEDKQRDPFQIFALGGDVFPRGDGDSYLSLCLQAKPDFQDQLYALFDSGSPPSLETVDALDSGSTWPKLRTLLGGENRGSVKKLLFPTICFI